VGWLCIALIFTDIFTLLNKTVIRSFYLVHTRFLNELYNLRSRIVHGQTVSNGELEKALPKAEDALRIVWRWYFDRYADEADNTAGIKEIGEQLVGG
jgi:hypothetical protein